MECECLFPRSQEPATGDYPELDKSSPQDSIVFLYYAF
jgi:hypothetical protein